LYARKEEGCFLRTPDQAGNVQRDSFEREVASIDWLSAEVVGHG